PIVDPCYGCSVQQRPYEIASCEGTWASASWFGGYPCRQCSGPLRRLRRDRREHPAALRRLDVVHRLVRTTDQVLRISRVVGEGGDAEAGRQLDRTVWLVCEEGLAGDLPADAARRCYRLVLAGLRHHDHELVAAVAHWNVGRAQRLQEQPANLVQHLRAGLVAVAVVHPLEVVQVEEDHRDRVPEPGGAHHFLLELPLPVARVEEAGVLVEDRQLRPLVE